MRRHEKSYAAGWATIITVCTLVFLGNLRHSSEQGIFVGSYVPLAHALIDTGSYAHPQTGAPAFYPMWGYALVIATLVQLSLPPTLVLLLQFATCLVGLVYAYRLAWVNPRPTHAFFLIPYFAVCSVKWPLAFVASLLPLCVYGIVAAAQGSIVPSLLAGVLLALLVNMRPELLLFLILAVIWALARRDRRVARSVSLAAAVAAISLVPWAIRSYRYDGSIRLGSTNLGGVLYISLGQLPDNPWGVEFADESAFAYASGRGICDPWSPEGDRVLKRAFFAAVRRHPGAYVRKLLLVAYESITGGIYTGEYDEWVSAPTKASLKRRLANAKSVGDLLRLADRSVLPSLFVGALEKSLAIIFRVVWLFALTSTGILLLSSFTVGRPGRRDPGVANSAAITFRFLHPEVPLLLVYVLSQLLVACFVQYQPRHLNGAYLCLVVALYRMASITDDRMTLPEYPLYFYEPPGARTHSS